MILNQNPPMKIFCVRHWLKMGHFAGFALCLEIKQVLALETNQLELCV